MADRNVSSRSPITRTTQLPHILAPSPTDVSATPIRTAVGNVSSRSPIADRGPIRTYQSPSTGGAGSTPGMGDASTGSASNTPNYGDDPLGVIADLYSRIFAPQVIPTRSNQPTQVVPVGTSGGNSALPLLLILAAGGFAVYWFYFRKKASAE